MLLSWGIVKGASPALCLYAPLTKDYMATLTFRNIYDREKSKFANSGEASIPYNNFASYDEWLKGDNIRGLYTDDDYLTEISAYSDKPWYQYLLTNPWLAGNQAQFSPSFWQQVGEQFGDFQARDSYNANLRSQRSNWLSEFVEKMRQEETNSAAAQVEREKAAGLNPDLTGNITAGSAAENDQPFSPVPFPMGSDAGGVVQMIGSTAMSFVSNLLGMAQSFQSLKAGNNDLVSQELRNNSDARDFVLNEIAGSSFFNNENDLDYMSAEDLANNILGASIKIDYSPYSPRTRKLIKRMFNRYANDVKSGRSPLAVESLKSELRNRIASNNRSAAGVAGSPVFDEDFMVMVRKIAETVGSAEYKAQIAEYRSRASKAGYDSKYFHGLDADVASKATNDSNRATSAVDSQKAIVEGMWNDIYKICKESNTWYGTIGLVLIPFLRSMASNASVAAGRLKNGKFGLTGVNL